MRLTLYLGCVEILVDCVNLGCVNVKCIVGWFAIEVGVGKGIDTAAKIENSFGIFWDDLGVEFLVDL